MSGAIVAGEMMRERDTEVNCCRRPRRMPGLVYT